MNYVAGDQAHVRGSDGQCWTWGGRTGMGLKLLQEWVCTTFVDHAGGMNRA